MVACIYNFHFFYVSSCFSVHTGLFDRNVNGIFQECHHGVRAGQGESRGDCSLLIQVDGQVGGQFFQQVHTLFRG